MDGSLVFSILMIARVLPRAVGRSENPWGPGEGACGNVVGITCFPG